MQETPVQVSEALITAEKISISLFESVKETCSSVSGVNFTKGKAAKTILVSRAKLRKKIKVPSTPNKLTNQKFLKNRFLLKL